MQKLNRTMKRILSEKGVKYFHFHNEKVATFVTNGVNVTIQLIRVGRALARKQGHFATPASG